MGGGDHQRHILVVGSHLAHVSSPANIEPRLGRCRHTGRLGTRSGRGTLPRFEEAAQEFYKRISEKVNKAFMKYEDKLKGIVVGGPGMTKQYFLDKELIDYRLREKILGQVDTSYTDESGIREVVQRS